MTCPHCGTQNENLARLCKKCGRPLRSAGLEGAITCKHHGNRRATTSCAACGDRLCDSCAVEAGGLVFCAGCGPASPVSERERINRLAVVDTATAAPAGFGARLAAAAVDWLVISLEGLILAGLFWMITGVAPLSRVSYRSAPADCLTYWALMAACAAGYFILFTAAGGQTLGKQAMDIAVVCEDGAAPTLARSWRRFLASLVSLAVFGLGYLCIMADPQQKAWHDRWSGTRVVSLD